MTLDQTNSLSFNSVVCNTLHDLKMPELNQSATLPSAEARQKMHMNLLREIEALEEMLAVRSFHTEPSIGIECEATLVRRDNQALGRAGPEVVSDLTGLPFTTELGKHQVEFNPGPIELKDTALSDCYQQQLALLTNLRSAAEKRGLDVLLIGIPPTLIADDLGHDNMVSSTRYNQANQALQAIRGGRFPISVRGIEPIRLELDNFMGGVIGASYQYHLALDPQKFSAAYNATLIALGPLIALGANSPLLFGRRALHESRIITCAQASSPERCFFPTRYMNEPLAAFRELLHEKYVPLFVSGQSETVSCKGSPPLLPELTLQNGSVWRWVRPRYGVQGNVPHLRFENRALSAGPSILDQIANLAFGLGLTYGLLDELGAGRAPISCLEARGNFFRGAMLGLSAEMHFNGRKTTADKLCISLLPLAHQGLAKAGVSKSDARYFLDGVIMPRIITRQTGSAFLLDALNSAGLKPDSPAVLRRQLLAELTKFMIEQQQGDRPVHEWRFNT